MHSEVSENYPAAAPLQRYGAGPIESPDWAISLMTHCGMKGRPGANQDACSFTLLESGWMISVACDGHGEKGEIISDRIAKTLPFFLSQRLAHRGPEEALPIAFWDAAEDLEESFIEEQQYSGTTAAVCCLHAESHECWFAHCGDSRIALGDIASGRLLFTTSDHKPHDPEELKRLVEAGAEVQQKRHSNNEVVSRIFVPGTGAPGLAMSRTFGNACLQPYGMTPEPQVTNVSNLWKACKAPTVILASDGLWNATSEEDAIQELTQRFRSGLDLAGCMAPMVRNAQEVWLETMEDYCDDVTVVLMAHIGNASH